MKLETRVEFVALLLGAVVVGGWMGLRLTRSPAQADKAQPAVREKVADSDRASEAERPTVAGTIAKREREEGVVAPPRDEPTPHAPKVVPAAVAAAEPTKPPQPIVAAEKPVTVTPEPARREAQDRTALETAAKLIAGDKKFEARAVLTGLILAAGEGPYRTQVKKMLDDVNRELFFSRMPSKDCVFHVVQPGDTLSGISKKQNKDLYFSRTIMLLNNIHDAKRIRAGQRLKIPVGEFSALVQRRSYRLILFFNGQYIKEYSVGLGAKETPTPVGGFRIEVKQVKPAWTTPAGEVYRYGDPRNILGTRWIGFASTREYQGYGIHGTNDPKTVGKNVSSGCVRMLNADIEEIFGMLMAGDTTRIVD